MKTKCIAVIPARGGSKRVSRKNISLLNGKPLLWYSIDSANKSNIFDSIYVNSEDDEILNKAIEFGVKRYKRPEQLATDEASIIDVIKDMIVSLNLSDDDVLCILLPTAPLRKSIDIKNGYDLFKNNKMKSSVVSVTTYETPIQLAQYLDENNHIYPIFENDYKKSTKSTGHKLAYKFNEVLVINNVKGFKEHSNLIGNNPLAYIMSSEDSYTIDYEYQKNIIELLLKQENTNEN